MHGRADELGFDLFLRQRTEGRPTTRFAAKWARVGAHQERNHATQFGVVRAPTVGSPQLATRQLNIDDPDQPWAIKYREAGHRSLSGGDVVAIGETAWAVAARGGDLITADELHAAIYHH